MPHFLLKRPKIKIDKVSAELLTYAEILIREFAEKKVAEIIDYLRQQCPPQDVIERMLATTNKITKQIAKAGRRAKKVKRLSDQLKIAIDVAKVIINIIAHFNIPSSFGIPPGPAGGHLFAFNLNLIMTRAAKLKFYNEIVELLEEKNDNINEVLTNFNLVFIPLQAKLELINALLNRCSQNPDLSQEERLGLLTVAKDQETNKPVEYTSQSGTIYTIKVTTDPNSPAIAPQRRAIAIDKKGVPVLKGPLSFASDSNVLIEELKFRIDNQLP
tara:strand:+ start:316 stop:1131 length:816 start_codon:yes stop_codon:yes gene_type:complete